MQINFLSFRNVTTSLVRESVVADFITQPSILWGVSYGTDTVKFDRYGKKGFTTKERKEKHQLEIQFIRKRINNTAKLRCFSLFILPNCDWCVTAFGKAIKEKQFFRELSLKLELIMTFSEGCFTMEGRSEV